MSEVDVEKELLKLKRQIGQFYSQGRYDEALESAIDMQTKIGDLMGTTNVMYASALNNVALMSKMCFDFERAIETYTEALHVYEDVVGRKHPSYMVTLSNLGAAYRAFAESKKGLEKQELLQRAMEALHDAYDFHKEIHGTNNINYLLSF
jgi:tetratricopeptide (TPR) repeat protein